MGTGRPDLAYAWSRMPAGNAVVWHRFGNAECGKMWCLICMYCGCQEVSAKTGVPRNSIVPIKNYCTEFEPTVKPGILILRGVYEALNAATDYLREYSDPLETPGEFKPSKVCNLSHCTSPKRPAVNQVPQQGVHVAWVSWMTQQLEQNVDCPSCCCWPCLLQLDDSLRACQLRQRLFKRETDGGNTANLRLRHRVSCLCHHRHCHLQWALEGHC
jgi:hypothetical protein